MPERKASALIGDMLKCILHLREYTSHISFEEFSFEKDLQRIYITLIEEDK